MKKVCLVFVVVVVFANCVSMSPEITKATKYSEVIDVSGVSAPDLFTKINLWCVSAFNSAESVIEYTDKDAGVLKGKFVFNLPMAGSMGLASWRVRSTLTIEVRDEKYRIEFADAYCAQVSYQGEASSEQPIPSKKVADEIIAKWTEIAEDLKNNLSLTPSSDW